jgi:hypothetical protein
MRKKATERVNGKEETRKRRPQPRFINWRTFDPTKDEGDRTLLEELITYKDHLEELLKRKGDYVLIKGRQVVGIFSEREQAVERAYDLFGGQPALVKQIVAKEPIHTLGGGIL